MPELNCAHSRPDKYRSHLEADTGKLPQTRRRRAGAAGTNLLLSPAVLTEHQLFDVFNNAIVSFYRSEDEGGGDEGGGGGAGGGGNAGSDGSSRNERGGSSSSSGGGAANGDAGGTGDCGNSNTGPAGNGGVSSGVVSGGMTTNDALLFHEKCGTLIKLSNNNKTAERRRPLDEFNNGVVMTNRPLRHNEMFEVLQIMWSRITFSLQSSFGKR